MPKHRISIDIDDEEHKYLKMCCAKLQITIKQFVTNSVLERVDEYEDKWMLERWERDGTREQIEKERNDTNRISFEMKKTEGEFFFTEMKGDIYVGKTYAL